MLIERGLGETDADELIDRKSIRRPEQHSMIIPKVMSRQGLRSFLRETSALSEKMAHLKKLSSNNIKGNDDNGYADEMEALVERARQLVSSVTIDTLGAELPDRLGLEEMSAPMYYADVYKSEHFHVCLFGFKNRDFVLPLHDHPEMYGFVKVIRGALTVSSYTELSHSEQQEVKRNKRHASSPNVIAVRFEGNDNRWSSDECVSLGPKIGNIHSVAPLEDGTAFFDLLIPGYGDSPCTYFKTIGRNPKREQTCLLQKTAEPEDYFCQVLPYEMIKTL